MKNITIKKVALAALMLTAPLLQVNAVELKITTRF